MVPVKKQGFVFPFLPLIWLIQCPSWEHKSCGAFPAFCRARSSPGRERRGAQMEMPRVHSGTAGTPGSSGLAEIPGSSCLGSAESKAAAPALLCLCLYLLSMASPGETCNPQHWFNRNCFPVLILKQLVKSVQQALWTALCHWKIDIFQFIWT